MRALPRGAMSALILILAAFHSLLLPPVAAVFVSFQNCLPSSTINGPAPRLLQFTPYFVDATFNQLPDSHWLNLTVYGNVSGQQTVGNYPPPSDPSWRNNMSEFGKITDQGGPSGDRKYTTLSQLYQVLTYDAFRNNSQFCQSLVNGTTCPVGPSFDANASDPYDLSAFAVAHDFGSSYAFGTISTTLHVISGDENAQTLACVSAQITADLGVAIAGLLTWLPAGILILKGIATLSAAIWSPWGSSDIFRWSSNYGRDEDLLRLVTPGFGDCLQYIQFIVLTGSLSLQYPGFYQPAVSQASWSTLLFNQSFINGGNGTASLQDGIYVVNATYGMTAMSQLIGMNEPSDIWACMAIWLVVIAVAVVLLCQLGFFGRWIYRRATHTSEEDLRQKNLPFTLGNMIRLLFNFFILPIASLSLFQLVIAGRSPTSVVACAVVLLVIMVVSAGWILHVIFRTKPRVLLFDEMPTVLLYGPLYNTYSDSAAPFALIPVFLTFMRAVAIGAVQPSGIAQLIVLAICEVILILTLNGFRPFQGQTSMNLYHTFFSSVRLVTIMLMIAFVPSLGVTEAPKGWIGYVVLLLHACVLVFGFFLNAMQTIIEVLARAFGAGHDGQNGAIRGSVLNWRTLKRRPTRRNPTNRSSMMSSAAILRDGGISPGYGGRSRSISASSQQLLNRMSGFDNFSSANDALGSPELESAGGTGTMSSAHEASKPAIIAKADGADNYYRPPRQRKATLDELTAPGIKTRSTGDFPYQDSPGQPVGHARDASYDSSAFGSPAPAYLRARHESADESGARTDYAVREVDQYYRGPALNDQPSRKLKTGPADPEGPASTAQSWFQKFVFGVTGGKKKDQSKGFEVVRSARMAPGMQQDGGAEPEGMELQQSPPMHQQPYHDDVPDTAHEEVPAIAGTEQILDGPDSPVSGIVDRAQAQSFDFDFVGTNDGPGTRVRPDSDAMGAIEHPVLQPISTEHRASMGLTGIPRRFSEVTMESHYTQNSSRYPDEEPDVIRYSDQPAPALDPIDLVGTLDLPSRFNSTAGPNGVPARSPYNGGLAPGIAPSRNPSNRSGGGLSNFESGQDWLRAMDNLDWTHDRQPSTRDPQVTAGGLSQQSSFRAPPPVVPRRNSRRASQHGIYQPRPDSYFGAFDSNPSPELESPGEERVAGGHTHHQVSHHRAADSITRNSFGATAALNASSAEYFSQTPPRSRDEDSYFRD